MSTFLGEDQFDFGNRLPDRIRVLYGYWPGYLNNPDWIELRKQIDDVGGDFIQAHASGHIYTDDLFDLIAKLNARRVLPIHTFEPQIVERRFPNAISIADGQSLEVD